MADSFVADREPNVPIMIGPPLLRALGYLGLGGPHGGFSQAQVGERTPIEEASAMPMAAARMRALTHDR